ncbi:MAG: hypothetical protein JSS27_18030 [Planctomycetes bacterium]|nr:hypothetical protein [Planctomycetota bacterium]
MAKAFSIIALILALGLIVVFGLDLAMEIPFKKASPTMDYGFIACSVILAFLSWQSFREQP